MRISLVSLLLLLPACDSENVAACGQVFCLPSEANLLGKQAVEDFNLYQVEWNGERFGIYEGDFPDFDQSSNERISIGIDDAAQFRVKNGEGQILAQIKGRKPQYVHLAGPCASRDACPLINLAAALKLR